MKKAKKLLALFLALALAASLAACGSSDTTSDEEAETEEAVEAGEDEEEAAEPAEGEEAAEPAEEVSGEKVFRYSKSVDPTTLDASKGNSIGDNEIQHAITEGLVRNTGGEISPGIAETWEISDDGLTYTFHLREAYWSDGVQITANDFVYGLQRLLDPETASPYAWIGEYVQNGYEVETGEMDVSELGVTAEDDMTVVIQLVQPTSYFLSLIGSNCQYAPARQDIVEEYGTDYAADGDKNVYSGPFVLESYEGNVLTFVKNENYWNADAVNFDRVELYIVTETATALAMYEEGSLDYVEIPVEQVQNYEGQDQTYRNGNDDFLYICEASDNTILNNRNFRLALNYATNRNDYITLAVNGVYEPATTYVMPDVDGVEGTYGEEYGDRLVGFPVDGDVELAQEYLAQAMEEEGISDPSEISVEITITDAESEKKIGEVIQEMWQNNLGINVTLNQVLYADKYGTIYPNHEFEIGYGGWGPDYSDPYTYLELFKSDSASNNSAYVNEDYDALLEAAQAETDDQTRMDLLYEAEQMLLDDAAMVPLQNRVTHYLIDDDVTDITFYNASVNIDWAFGDCDPVE